MKIVSLYLQLAYYSTLKFLETKKAYRKFKGGCWYYVVDVEGNEYWTRSQLPLEYGFTLDIEQYDNKKTSQ